MKRLSCFCLLLVVLVSCTSKAQMRSKKNCIHEFISAITSSDSIQFYTLVDTSSFFKVQDKERLLYIANYVNDRLSKCDSLIDDNAIKIRDVAVESKEYIVGFCRGSNGEILNGKSFDLHFTFRNFDKKNKIVYLDITNYNSVNTPTQPHDSN